MKLYRLHRSQQLPISLDTAWDFFSNPQNLAVITPPWLNLKPAREIPEKMHPGMIITYRVRPFRGVGITWITEITHVQKPHFFVDEQRFGPYKFWHHQHHFRQLPRGIEAVDIVHYALPFGPLGRIARALTVKNQLERIFEFRRKFLEDMFGILD